MNKNMKKIFETIVVVLLNRKKKKFLKRFENDIFWQNFNTNLNTIVESFFQKNLRILF